MTEQIEEPRIPFTDEQKVNVICNLTGLAACLVLFIASFRHAWFVPVGTIEFGLGFVLAGVTQNLRYRQAIKSMANVSLEIVKAAGK